MIFQAPFSAGPFRLLLLTALLGFATGCGPFSKSPLTAPLASSRLISAMHSAAAYLAQACGPDGRFLYRINPQQIGQLPERYNILRHAGTLYALSCYAALTQDEACRQACARAADFMKTASLGNLPDRNDLLAVWSYPLIEHTTAPAQAKLGGTGLALAALASLDKVMPGATAHHDLQRMAEFIIYMQKQDGSFYSKYIPSAGGRSDQWSSLYYPGEAALGLVMLFEKDRNPRWLQASADALAYLAGIRSGQQHVPADHWALLATARLMPHYGICRQKVSTDSLLRHAAQICESILAARPSFPPQSACHGALAAYGSTCASATRLEGLLAALEFLPEDGSDLRRRVSAAVCAGIDFLIQSQIQSGRYAGGIPRNVCCTAQAASAPRAGDCLPRASEIRIDYVQHALSAMMMYQRISSGGASAADHHTHPR